MNKVDLERRYERTLRDLIDRYGFTMVKNEVGAVLDLAPKEVIDLCQTKLPVMKRRGRGGNRYLARDVAAFKVARDHGVEFSIDRGVDLLIKELIGMYGYTMHKRDVESALKLKSQALLFIPADKLPCDRRRGRLGNVYLAKDVAAYMIGLFGGDSGTGAEV